MSICINDTATAFLLVYLSTITLYAYHSIVYSFTATSLSLIVIVSLSLTIRTYATNSTYLCSDSAANLYSVTVS